MLIATIMLTTLYSGLASPTDEETTAKVNECIDEDSRATVFKIVPRNALPAVLMSGALLFVANVSVHLWGPLAILPVCTLLVVYLLSIGA
jgi:hypothetical protein